MKSLPDAVLSLVKSQWGVVTRQQLLGHGVSKETIRWHAGRSWRVILPCIYVIDANYVSEKQRLMGALLYAGPLSRLAGASAASQHGIANANARGRVLVVVPGSQASRSKGYVSIRRTLLDDPLAVARGGLRLSSVARACVDAAVAEPSMCNRTALIVEAVQRELVTVDALAEWCYRLRPGDGAKVLPAVETAALGVWSVPEGEVFDLMGTSSLLPEPLTNPRLCDASGCALLTPDLWLDDVAMAVMVHSRQYHSTGDQFVDTIERDSELVAAGVVVLGVTPTGVRRDPGATLRRIEAAYAVALRRERPAVRVRPRVTSLAPQPLLNQLLHRKWANHPIYGAVAAEVRGWGGRWG